MELGLINRLASMDCLLIVDTHYSVQKQRNDTTIGHNGLGLHTLPFNHVCLGMCTVFPFLEFMFHTMGFLGVHIFDIRFYRFRCLGLRSFYGIIQKNEQKYVCKKSS